MKKRCFAWILILALAVLLLPATGVAATEGEMLLTSEPVEGAVGDIVKVEFYCYPNLPEGELLDSLEFSLSYDPEMLTFGSFNMRDEEKNLASMMYGKSAQPPMWNLKEPGLIVLAWAELFGTDQQGFLFQLEFRIEKEGASDFLFNSVRYHTINGESYASVASYYINPVHIGGVKTAGEEIPEEPETAETYAPLEPAMETPAPQPTDTPKPSNGGQTVPKTSSLPEPTNIPTKNPEATGIVTPEPAVTSMPMNTPAATQSAAATAKPTAKTNPTQKATQAPATTDAPNTEAPNTEAPNTEAPETQQPEEPETTPEPNEQVEATDEPLVVTESTPDIDPDKTNPEGPNGTPENVKPASGQQPNRALVIAVIAGIVVVILLAALAIVLILIHNKKQRDQE